MSDKQRMIELDQIAEDLFKMANDFMIEKKPGVFVYLRESVNNIKNAQENFKLNYQKMDEDGNNVE
jgi:hypothetical protein